MSPQSLETLFLRFRDSCDPAAMAEVFDRAAPELRPLARHLTRGRLESDDLVQETFLAAIEHRASYDEARPLMPWLVGILIRQASSARRRERRDLDPERLQQRAVETPEADLESGEFQHLVMEALARLSRRDRDVLVPLLFDGKRAVQIARELGHRPDTIRMRIHRGLARLRRSLPAGVALPGLVPFGRGWSEVRQSVLTAAARAGGSQVVVPAAGGLSSAAAWVAIVLLATLGITWGVGAFELGAGTGSTAELTGALAQTPPVESPVQRAEASRGRTAVAGVALAPTPVPETVSRALMLEGRVTGLEFDEWKTTSVDVQGLGPDPIAAHCAATLRADGNFEVDVASLASLGARRFLVTVDHAEHMPAEVRVERGEGLHLSAGTVELLGASPVAGSVLDIAGAPVEGASVGLYSMAEGSQDVNRLDVCVTETDGRFRLRSPSAGAHVVIAYREGLRPATRWVSLTLAPTELLPMQLERGLAIAGVVRGEVGASLEGVRVRCEASPAPAQRRLRLADRRFTRVGSSYELATGIATCDAAGNFTFGGLADHTFDVAVVLLPSANAVAWDPLPAATRIGARRVRPPRFDLDLAMPWSLLDFEFAAAVGRADRAAPDERSVDVVILPEECPAHMSPVTVRLRPALGEHARIQVSPGSRYKVELHGFESNGATQLVLQAPPGGQALLVPLETPAEGARASLLLTLDGQGLEAGEQIGVGFFPAGRLPSDDAVDELSGALFERSAPLDADHRIRLDDLPPGTWHARLRIGGTYSRTFGFFLPCAVDVELVSGSTCQRSVRTERGGSARLWVASSTGALLSARGRLFDASGTEHTFRCIALEPEWVREEAGRVVMNAHNELGPLRPGRWRLDLVSLGHEPFSLPFDIEVGRVVELEARLRPR